MNENDTDLARTVAAELGADVVAAVDAPPTEDATRAFGFPEAMAIGGFVISCAQLAMSIWQARQDRALLVEALVNSEELLRIYPQLDPEKRLGFMARVVNKLVPDSFARPAHDRSSDGMANKRRWIEDYLKSRRAPGGGSGEFAARDFQGGAVILVPFAEQNYWIVYKNIGWVPDDEDGPGVVPVDVPKGFVTDLTSVPNYLWAVLQNTGRYGNAAIYHDWLYWQQTDAGVTREVADRVFDRAMHDMGVDAVTRNSIWAGVRMFGGSSWEANAVEKVAGGRRVLKLFPDSPTITWNDWRQRADVFE